MTGRWSAVLFDFDYTLGDTERGIVASTRMLWNRWDCPSRRKGRSAAPSA